MRTADRQLLRAELDRHIEADCGQTLCQQEFVAPLGNVGTDLSPDVAGIGEDILGSASRANQLACPLLAYARHSGNVV